MTTRNSALRQLREMNRIKLIELAKVSKIHPSTLSLIENSWQNLNDNQARALIDGYRKFGIEVENTILKLVP